MSGLAALASLGADISALDPAGAGPSPAPAAPASTAADRSAPGTGFDQLLASSQGDPPAPVASAGASDQPKTGPDSGKARADSAKARVDSAKARADSGKARQGPPPGVATSGTGAPAASHPASPSSPAPGQAPGALAAAGAQADRAVPAARSGSGFGRPAAAPAGGPSRPAPGAGPSGRSRLTSASPPAADGERAVAPRALPPEGPLHQAHKATAVAGEPGEAAPARTESGGRSFEAPRTAEPGPARAQRGPAPVGTTDAPRPAGPERAASLGAAPGAPATGGRVATDSSTPRPAGPEAGGGRDVAGAPAAAREADPAFTGFPSPALHEAHRPPAGAVDAPTARAEQPGGASATRSDPSSVLLAGGGPDKGLGAGSTPPAGARRLEPGSGEPAGQRLGQDTGPDVSSTLGGARSAVVATLSPAGTSGPAAAQSGTPASPSVPPPPGQPAGVAGQLLAVLGPLRTSPAGAKSLTLLLHPAELGEVRATLSVADGQVSVRLVASTADGAAALRAALPDLRSGLGSAAGPAVVVLSGAGSGAASPGPGSSGGWTGHPGPPPRPGSSAPPGPPAEGAVVAVVEPPGGAGTAGRHRILDVRA